MHVADKKRVVVVTHVISGDLWAGAEAQVYQLISGLHANQQVVPTAVVFNPGILYEKLRTLGIKITVANETTLSPLGQMLTIRAHLRENGTDIVHTHGFKENILGTVAQHLARVPKSLRTAHGNPETSIAWQKPFKKLTQIFDDSLARYGQDAVVAVSRQLESTLSARYPGKTVRISNFIALDDAQVSEDADTSSLKEHKPPYRIALVGRTVPVKRLDLFIDTIALLQDQYGLDVIGAIYGEGPLLSAMKDYAARKAGDAIEFKGFVDNIPQELSTTDILLMPSDHEGLPMTLLEALSVGVPVVAHNTGGIPEVLNSGECGILVDDHSAEGYSAAVAQLISDQSAFANISSSAKLHIKKEFSAFRNILKYQDLYLHLYNKKKIPATLFEKRSESDSL